MTNPTPGDWVSPFDELLAPEATVPADPPPATATAEAFVLRQFTAVEVIETVVARTTGPGDLLEGHGVGVTRFDDPTAAHLADELARGHTVVLGYEQTAGHGHPVLDFLARLFGIDDPPAELVVRLDSSHPDGPHVAVTDPSVGGPAATCRLETFVEAWAGSDFAMVTTHDPAPQECLPMSAHDLDPGPDPMTQYYLDQADAHRQELADWHDTMARLDHQSAEFHRDEADAHARSVEFHATEDGNPSAIPDHADAVSAELDSARHYDDSSAAHEAQADHLSDPNS